MTFFFKLETFFRKFIVSLTGEFLISFFVTIYVILPLVNCVRSILLIQLQLIFFYFLFGFLLIFWVFLKLVPIFYYKITNFLFSDFLLECRHFIFLGAIFQRNFPSFFGLYVCFSLSSFHLIREYPDIFWIHFFYSLIVIFRNIFLLPALGYGVLFKINRKQKEYLSMNDKKNYGIFKQEFFVKNTQFLSNFEKWNSWIEKMTPTPNSLKITSRISLLTSCSWYFFYFIRTESQHFLLNMQKNQNTLDNYLARLNNTEKIPELEWFFEQITLNLKEKMQHLDLQVNSYHQENSIIWGITFLRNWSFFKDLQKESLELVVASMQLYYIKKRNQETVFRLEDKQNLLFLTKKYLPDSLLDLFKILTDHF